MKECEWSDEEIKSKLAENDEWSEGKLHVSINRLYLDVVCPSECSRNKIGNFGFMYCEEDCPYGDVCYRYKGASHKFGTESFI